MTRKKDDRFWAWLVKKLGRRPLTMEEAAEEYTKAPESPLSEEEIERLVRKVVDAE